MTILHTSDKSMTNTPLGAPFAPGRQSYRATFSNGDKADLIGEKTATWEGLDIGTWVGDSTILKVLNGVLVGHPGASGFVGLPILGINGVHATWLVRRMPLAGTIYLDIFRSIGSSVDAYRLQLDSTAGARLVERIGATMTPLSGWFPVPNGSTVGIRWVGGVLSLFVNRVAKIHVPINSVSPVGYTGVAVSATSSGFELDNPEIDDY